MIVHSNPEEVIRAAVAHPLTFIASDGLRGHPRHAGTSARILGRYVREERVLSLAEMIVHLATRPAALLGLHDRGRIAEGYVADIVVFDPATVADRATPDEPRRTPVGIPWVFVGSTPVIENGVRTTARPGGALRHRGTAVGG